MGIECLPLSRASSTWAKEMYALAVFDAKGPVWFVVYFRLAAAATAGSRKLSKVDSPGAASKVTGTRR